MRNDRKEPFTLFKTYKVCALAGSLGLKRMEGDYQLPEGFYYINEFNPKSNYHLSLGINYPNASDKVLSDSYKPGGDIYIHGSCVTVGCIPVKDALLADTFFSTLQQLASPFFFSFRQSSGERTVYTRIPVFDW